MQYDETDDITYPYTDETEGTWEPRVTNSGTYRIDGGASNPNLSIAVQAPERKYSVETSLPFSRFLNKESSARYQAIVLNASSGGIDTAHFEVGLVHVKNADHRNGVVHALRVSPFHVDFIALDEAFFEYMHSHIYSAKTQLSVLEFEQKKKSQKTKQWGEGVSTLSAEEVLSAQAVS